MRGIDFLVRHGSAYLQIGLCAHANSAPDHEPIQGKQYSDAEYAALNGSLVRRIGTLNCGHAAFPIILGVNEPQFTPEQLEKFREDNAEGVTYDGRHYTGYEATQTQRKLERAMRLQKRRILTAEATGDKDALAVAQTRLQRLRQEYSRFSKAAGLRTENERAQVAGFGRKEAARATAADANFKAFVSQLTGLKTNTGVQVEEISVHAFARLTSRGVSAPDIAEALTAPLKVGKIRKDRSQQFVGERATAVINIDTGKIVTVWPTSAKRATRMKGGKSS